MEYMYHLTTWDPASPVHWAIAAGQGRKMGHSILAFSKEPTHDIERMHDYFESLSSEEQYWTRHHGIKTKTGPRYRDSMLPLVRWRDAKRGRKVYVQPILGHSQDDIQWARDRAHQQCGTIYYAKVQIVQNALMMKVGRLGRLRTISDDKMTCSEFVADKLNRHALMDTMGAGRRFILDWVSPAGRPFGLWELIELSNKEFKRLETSVITHADKSSR